MIGYEFRIGANIASSAAMEVAAFARGRRCEWFRVPGQAGRHCDHGDDSGTIVRTHRAARTTKGLPRHMGS